MDPNSLKIFFLFFPGIISISIIQLFNSRNKKFSTSEIFIYSLFFGILSYVLAYFISFIGKSIALHLDVELSGNISNYIRNRKLFIILIISLILSLLSGNYLIVKFDSKFKKIKKNFKKLISILLKVLLLIIFSRTISYVWSLVISKEYVSRSYAYAIFFTHTYIVIFLIVLILGSQIVVLINIFSKKKLSELLNKFETLIIILNFIFLAALIGFFFSKISIEHFRFHEVLIGILNNKPQEVSIGLIIFPSIIGLILGKICISIKRETINKYFFESKVSYDGLGDLKNSFVKIILNNNSQFFLGKITFFEFHESQIEIRLEETKIILKNNRHKYSKGEIYLTLLPGTYRIEKIKTNKMRLIKEKKLYAYK